MKEKELQELKKKAENCVLNSVICSKSELCEACPNKVSASEVLRLCLDYEFLRHNYNLFG